MNAALMATALDIAAASGAFEPAALADALGFAAMAPERDLLWREMSKVVDEVRTSANPTSPGYGWFLTPDQRRARLAEFTSRTQLDRILAEAPPVVKDDLFGAALREILAGQSARIQEAAAAHDDTALATALSRHAAILDAVQFALEVPLLDRTALLALEDDAKRQIQLLQRRRDLTVVLPRRHRGYSTELGEISAFMRGKTRAGRPLLLTGIGGVGKSAILARILQGWQGHKDAPLTVILDFDRRQLNGGQPVEIVSEMLRQLESRIAGMIGDGAKEAEIAKGLKTVRRGLPTFTATGGTRDYTSQYSTLVSWLPGALSQPWAAGLRTLPIAMVFDSFEAVDRRGVEIVKTILNVEKLLRGQFGSLRTVVSGRAEPLSKTALRTYFGAEARRIKLIGLSPAAGARLLAEEDRRLAGDGAPLISDPALYAEASRALNGHPLALIIFAQYARSHPEDVADLIADLRNNEDFRDEFAQVFLYERILGRIDDPVLNRLAHPGLILRQISADLIRFVLAGPCLGEGPSDAAPMSATRAKELLKHLGDEYWLVERGDPPFALAHRADLRRLMLPGLFAGPREKDTAERRAEKTLLRDGALAACAAAARYFDEGPPANAGAEPHKVWRAIDDRTRRAHALYYSSFTRPAAPEAFDAATARDIDDEIGADVDTMPLAWRARINVLRGLTPTDAELATLPPDLREIGEARRFKNEEAAGLGKTSPPKKARRAKRAAKGKITTRPGASGSIAPAAPNAERLPSAYERDIQRAFAAAAFDAVAQLAPDYFAALTARPDEDTARRFREGETEGYWRHPLWQCLLTAAAGIGADRIAAAAERHLKAESPYQPVYAAIIAAANDAPDEVVAALSPIFQRNIVNPVDVNRAHGRGMYVRRGDSYENPSLFSPAALCLAAGWEERHDGLGALEFPGSEGILKFRASGRPNLSTLSKLYDQFGGRLVAAQLENPTLEPWQRDLATAMLRGLNPDLQIPLAAQLATVPGGDVERILQGIMPRARYWPEELIFGDERRYIAVQSNVVVETADQCGVLRDLIEAVAESRLDLRPLLSMYDAITDWFFPFAKHAPS